MGDMKKIGKIWADYLESIVLSVTIIAVVVISMMDLLDVLDEIPFIDDKVPTITLLLLSALGGYLIVDRREYLSQIRTSLVQTEQIRLLGIRENMDEVFRECFTSSKQIDMIALTGEHLIGSCGKTSFVEKLTTQECEIRILILDPDSIMWRARVADEDPSVPRNDLDNNELDHYLERIWTQKENILEFFESVKKEVLPKNCKGILTVKYYDRIPYFGYFRGDDKAILGINYAHTFGIKGHAIEITENLDMLGSLGNHFDSLWYDRRCKLAVNVTKFTNKAAE